MSWPNQSWNPVTRASSSRRRNWTLLTWPYASMSDHRKGTLTQYWLLGTALILAAGASPEPGRSRLTDPTVVEERVLDELEVVGPGTSPSTSPGRGCAAWSPGSPSTPARRRHRAGRRGLGRRPAGRPRRRPPDAGPGSGVLRNPGASRSHQGYRLTIGPRRERTVPPAPARPGPPRGRWPRGLDTCTRRSTSARAGPGRRRGRGYAVALAARLDEEHRRLARASTPTSRQYAADVSPARGLTARTCREQRAGERPRRDRPHGGGPAVGRGRGDGAGRDSEVDPVEGLDGAEAPGALGLDHEVWWSCTDRPGVAGIRRTCCCQGRHALRTSRTLVDV